MKNTRSLLIDTLIVILALFSIVLLLVEIIARPSSNQVKWFARTDLTICAVFFVEFTSRLLYANSKKAYLQRNWIDIIAMIPVTDPAIRWVRGLRIVRLARIARVVRTARITRLTRSSRLNFPKLFKLAKRVRKVYKARRRGTDDKSQ